MNHASLFSGIGGAEVAAQMMGWNNLFHCEIQDFPRRVLNYWFPKSISYEDIKKTDFSPWRGRVDVLTGGFPCQPFSVAGKRKGADDDRYLWPQMLRAISEIRPTWIVGENVAGIKTMVEPGEEIKMGSSGDIFEKSYIYRKEQQFTLERICQDLECEGYSVQAMLIPACSVGAPHKRDRIWIVAHRSDPRTEILQQTGQDKFSSFRNASNPNCSGQRHRKNKQVAFARSKRETNLGIRRKKRSSSYSECIRRDKVLKNSKSEKSNGKKPYGSSGERYVTRLISQMENWRFEDFPTTQPTIRRGNDGLPFNVDSLTISFPKWREESIKCLGNAWVPQVAYEIFRSIQIVEESIRKGK